MKITENPCLINGLRAVRISITFDYASPGLTVGYKFIKQNKKKEVHAAHFEELITGHMSWSKRTNELMEWLVDSIERDLLKFHFNTPTSGEEEHAGIKLGIGKKTDQI